MRVKIFFAYLFISLVPVFVASAEEAGCVKCHKQLLKGKVVHSAAAMNQIGCSFCHSGILASRVPHGRSNIIDHGLRALQPALRYECHNRDTFKKKDVHPALGMGCTTCHNPHSTDTQKLLVAEQPDLCYNCHDKGMFG